ncbi:hypothetical protein BU24DRAFT_461999 [Aaosphaeria arxii CBS 175.79]|uniref:Xylanolytic transcriptional activator regulatory domain-containing protein n=1 Tax=Aaosphaeria arxii CBS 175.79 TaxID=1450172 RepID=A0A6A5XR62_9PLEO|nr:uncharacterized protein BU24DRAFT_461999 [Aaosphaeria arxii CBS 175.79]KAF2015768.1 hypothetical protein BU24DRAFT_461999 [Aaosphaeria arxii CBS 175.79]
MSVPVDNLSTNIPQANPPAPIGRAPDERVHEIGFVAVGSNSDQRYVGPSSGHFLARAMLSRTLRNSNEPERINDPSSSFSPSIINELVKAARGPLPLPEKHTALQLSRVYFDIIHPQYPILHEPSFFLALDQIYEHNDGYSDMDKPILFQVYIVLAISSSIVSSRARFHVPGESYCLSALQYFDELSIENSLSGLQCLLLLLIFTLHSPFMRVNVWYVNYQCIACLLDLGLQRDITTSSGISLLTQEMRTRVFWTVLALDRTIATMMGRPIGLRDEACELRFPQNIDDHDLVGVSAPNEEATGAISFSIHLFKLTKLNSEIKYVANSIVRQAPPYAYLPITDIHAWNQDMLRQLDEWVAEIPQSNHHQFIRIVCELRYLSVKMLLLRPSPAIPTPSSASLTACHEVACRSIQLYGQLYRQDMLVHDWITLHGIVFSTITMLYCLRVVPDLAPKTKLDVVMSDLSLSLSLISASGEHWSGAKRCREILDELGRSTVQGIKNLGTPQVNHRGSREGEEANPNASSSTASIPYTQAPVDILTTGGDAGLGFIPSLATPPSIAPGMLANDTFLFNPVDQYGFSDSINVDDIMRNLFDDFIP